MQINVIINGAINDSGAFEKSPEKLDALREFGENLSTQLPFWMIGR